MKRYTKGIHKVMDDDYQLADTYAQDGAFHSAANVLQKLAEKVKDHAKACDILTDAFIAKQRKGKSNGKRT